MLFDPEESIDFHGNTGPFIQYTYARIFSIIKRADILKLDYNNFNSSKILKTTSSQKKLINHIYQFSDAIDISSDSYSPSVIAKYVYELAKNYNSFYQDDKIFDGKNNETTLFKISLSKMVLKTIKNALLLLNIRVPNKM